ncbi:SDR family NAD(P)-dependent oxidoreductase [Corynebacterium choanae]|uniref:3-ketoacyl-(Acyl-carrier-protein) reductase n=1 Tax=Corynebacterium choanae TaxID=1862358 RepID=A0A3G6J6K4_9CORY|nr:SDR family NAD(P)-dependent oxidoreductase [Corynebacterium choanae]AZA13586.1 3-ketoacyl-(acyl-carrier-protein) reductase [Corynebacterium choanae]
MSQDAIDPTELACALRVLEQAGALDPTHPDSVTLQHAVSKLFKAVKRSRRNAAKQRIRQADRQVLAATATAHPRRIDDETAGLLISPNKALANSHTPGAVATPYGFAGKLHRPQNCYICKQPYTLVDSFHHQLCPTCAADNHARREARVDLTGRRALLTGGRAKIGMYIALKLLRDGCDVTITTRFPRDAVRRFTAIADADTFLDRLHVIGVDLRDPRQVVAVARKVASAGPLDILINNAAQTVRRLPGAYSGLVDAEQAPLAGKESEVDLTIFGSTSHLHPHHLVGDGTPGQALTAGTPSETAAQAGHELSVETGNEEAANSTTRRAQEQIQASRLAALAMTGGAADLARVDNGTAIDAGGLIPDLVDHNSWVATIGQVDAVEMLEVQLCNATAPFILIDQLRPALEASPARRKYIVNVSAMEGVFSRGYKGPGHPHTNMAKAALNMLTRTSAQELFEHGILMTAVDTGWITDERPHTTKARLAQEGFHAPLDLVDGAARVYDPIVQGENGVDLYGCFLKDYKPSPW